MRSLHVSLVASLATRNVPWSLHFSEFFALFCAWQRSQRRTGAPVTLPTTFMIHQQRAHDLYDFDLYVFDLDGTLIDSRHDLCASVNRVLARCGHPALDVETVTGFIGGGARRLLERSLRRVLGQEASAAERESATELFLEDYVAHCAEETQLYPGVLEALRELEAAGRALALLTNKPLEPTARILEALGIAAHFSQVVGGDSVLEKKPSPLGLESILQRCGVPRERALLVGDSDTDARTAVAAGVDLVLVTYGFQPDAATAYPDAKCVDDLRELCQNPSSPPE